MHSVFLPVYRQAAVQPIGSYVAGYQLCGVPGWVVVDGLASAMRVHGQLDRPIGHVAAYSRHDHEIGVGLLTNWQLRVAVLAADAGAATKRVAAGQRDTHRRECRTTCNFLGMRMLEMLKMLTFLLWLERIACFSEVNKAGSQMIRKGRTIVGWSLG